MYLKQITIALLIAGFFSPVVHAADTAITEAELPQPRLAAAILAPLAMVYPDPVSVVGKSREQVIAEVVQAKKDGSYVSLPEGYPESFYFRPSR